jgi:hypothetical protein
MHNAAKLSIVEGAIVPTRHLRSDNSNFYQTSLNAISLLNYSYIGHSPFSHNERLLHFHHDPGE